MNGKLNAFLSTGLFLAQVGWLCLMQIPIATSATENEAQVHANPLKDQNPPADSNRAITQHTFNAGKIKFNYTATAASITVHNKHSKPIGEIFYIAYKAEQQDHNPRPLTFVFNGGPGAASAYLHLGALGPQRVVFNADGTVPSMPAKIVQNPKSWLAFTDLVFVDPVGTGYSRAIGQSSGSTKNNEDAHKSFSYTKNTAQAQVWGVAEDTESLSRFIRTFLTEEKRWLSPVYLVGESYGGFRVARLAKQMQTNFSIALSGVLLVSPVLDFSFIWGDKHSLWPWVALLPSYAAVATIHERSNEIIFKAYNPRASLLPAEKIAISEYLTGLAAGKIPPDRLDQLSKLTGLHKTTLQRWNGRIPPARFVKALLADQHRMVSLYDGSITLIDADPTKELFTGRDFYLDRLNAPITAALNSYVRDHLNYQTDLPYLLLNHNVAESWNWRSGIHGQQGYAEAATALKQAMSLNPNMQVLILHGIFDLVTPYYASEILINQMALDSQIQNNIQLKVYHGGHMPYLQQDTLNVMFEDIGKFYKLSP